MKFTTAALILFLLSCSFDKDRRLNEKNSSGGISIIESNNSFAKCVPPKYLPDYSKLIPLPAYFDFDEAVECAKLQDEKSILVVFDAIGSTRSKQMSSAIFSDKKILKYISDNYILVCLYTDDRTKLEEYYTSTIRGNKRIITTKGGRNIELQFEKTKSGSQPYFVVLDKEGNVINNALSLTKSKDYFFKWLQESNS